MTEEPEGRLASPPPFVARTSKLYQIWETVVIGGGLSALFASALLPVMPNGSWQVFAGAMAGIPLALSAYVVVFTPRRELRIDARGWWLVGFSDGPVPWSEVWTYDFVRLRGFSKKVISMQMTIPHRQSLRWRKQRVRSGGPLGRTWGDRSVEVVAVGWDQPTSAIFSAFEKHIEADRQQRRAEVHTTAVIPPSTNSN
ncbi:hypothetical protein AAFN86_20235 [Roseomonas sp. CAU 1739]|uniref:hypothetical protein n=1 Tax=Roseomonas sp. CAU 1739 TaxID=3140364 RepID=UPI00325B5253